MNEGASAKSAQKVSFAETNKPEKGTDIPPPFSKRLRVKFGLAPKPTFPPPAAAKPEANQTMQDFFSAIEEEQPTMFNPQTGRLVGPHCGFAAFPTPVTCSPTASYFQQQAMHKSFSLLWAPSQPECSSCSNPQPTGFMMPQQTAFQSQPQQQSNPLLCNSSSSICRSRHSYNRKTRGSLQPQPTGSNPFRQSMMDAADDRFLPISVRDERHAKSARPWSIDFLGHLLLPCQVLPSSVPPRSPLLLPSSPKILPSKMLQTYPHVPLPPRSLPLAPLCRRSLQ